MKTTLLALAAIGALAVAASVQPPSLAMAASNSPVPAMTPCQFSPASGAVIDLTVSSSTVVTYSNGIDCAGHSLSLTYVSGSATAGFTTCSAPSTSASKPAVTIYGCSSTSGLYRIDVMNGGTVVQSINLTITNNP